jgi:hypothetical protein
VVLTMAFKNIELKFACKRCDYCDLGMGKMRDSPATVTHSGLSGDPGAGCCIGCLCEVAQQQQPGLGSHRGASSGHDARASRGTIAILMVQERCPWDAREPQGLVEGALVTVLDMARTGLGTSAGQCPPGRLAHR